MSRIVIEVAGWSNNLRKAFREAPQGATLVVPDEVRMRAAQAAAERFGRSDLQIEPIEVWTMPKVNPPRFAETASRAQ